MARIKLTKDFSNKSKGDILDLGCSATASRLVKVRKVAVYFDEKKDRI